MLTYLERRFKMVINLTSLRDNSSAISVRKISSFSLFSMQTFCKQGLQRTNFQLWKNSSDLKVSIKRFRTISVRYLSVFLLNLKLTIMFSWKYIFVSTGLFWSALICFASCGSHFSSVFFFPIISVSAWQGLKSWYTIIMAFGLARQALAKNYKTDLYIAGIFLCHDQLYEGCCIWWKHSF